MNDKVTQDDTETKGGVQNNDGTDSDRRDGDHSAMRKRSPAGRHGKTLDVFELARRVYASAKTSRRSK